jgi:hypothetical protein
MSKPRPSSPTPVEREIEAALAPIRKARASLMRKAGGTVDGLVRYLKQADRRRAEAAPRAALTKPRRRTAG